MRGFLAAVMMMSLVTKPNYELYWSTQHLIETPGIRGIMSRDRFMNILSMLHISNNDDALPRDHPDHDRLQKIRPLIDLLVPLWQVHYLLAMLKHVIWL